MSDSESKFCQGEDGILNGEELPSSILIRMGIYMEQV